MIPTCIVEVTRVISGTRVYVREVEPVPNNTEIVATIASPVPMSQEAGGLHSVPEVTSGIRAIAVRYEAEYIILGFFPDYAPQLGARRTIDQEEALEPGDHNLRTSSGNRVTVTKQGRIDLFANLFSRLHLSQKKNQLEGYFKKLKFRWFGGSIVSKDERTTRIVLSDGYQDPTTSDENLGTDDLPTPDPQARSLDAYTYVDKAIIHNEDVPLHIETRQNTGGIAAITSSHKDVFTVEKRGYQGDDYGTLYEFQTIDRSRGLMTRSMVVQSGLSIDVAYSKVEPATPAARRAVSPDWNDRIVLGENVLISHVSGDGEIDTELSFGNSLNDRVKLRSNEDSLSIGNDLVLKRESDDGAYSLTIDSAGNVVFDTPQFYLSSSGDSKQVVLAVTDGNTLMFGQPTTTEYDGVLTPNSIFEGVDQAFDTFTGIPFKGSSIVTAKE